MEWNLIKVIAAFVIALLLIPLLRKTLNYIILGLLYVALVIVLLNIFGVF